MKKIFNQVIFLLICFKAIAGPHEEASSLDSKKNLSLLELVHNYHQMNKEQEKDSVFAILIEQLKSSDNHKALIDAYTFYANNISDNSNIKTFLFYANDMLKLANDCNEFSCLSEAHMMMSHAYLLNGDVQKAQEEGHLAYTYASKDKEGGELIMKSDITLGNAYMRNNNKIEAFKRFSDANLIALKIENDSMMVECLDQLYSFYFDISNYDSAYKLKQRQLKIIEEKHLLDSTAIMQIEMELAGCLFKLNALHEGENKLHEVIRYATLTGNEMLKSDAFLFFRNQYIESSNLKGIENLYIRKYPNELNRIRSEDTSLYYRLLAYIFDAQNKNDSASLYYNLAINQVKQQDNRAYLLPYLLNHYGNFLSRTGRIEEAIIQFKISYEYALQAMYLPFAVGITHQLDSLFNNQRMYDSAYKYRLLYDQYFNQLKDDNNKEQILYQSILNEAATSQILKEKEDHIRYESHVLQYTLIVLAILILFTILCLLGSFQVPRGLIKATNFIFFIFLFEFIVLIAEELTPEHIHGEPWKLMLFKLVLIAMLTPLHHWMEEKLLHYLFAHKLLDPSKIHFKTRLRKIIKWRENKTLAQVNKQNTSEKKQ